MARLRIFLTGSFQRAMAGWWRRQFSSGFGLAASFYALPRPEVNRAALLRIFGAVAATPEAEARGLRLLRENLSSAQREQQERYGYFEVRGGATGRRYRIKNGFQLNVELLDDKGRTTAVLCFMPAGNLVAGDVMLAQKLALELFEADTLKIANKFPVNQYWTDALVELWSGVPPPSGARLEEQPHPEYRSRTGMGHSQGF